MRTRFTPGPWKPTATPGGWDGVREPGGALICSLNLNNSANMLLLAAAPELLAALAWCVANDGECLGDHRKRLSAYAELVLRASGESAVDALVRDGPHE